MKMDRIEHEKRKWYVVRDTLAKCSVSNLSYRDSLHS